MKRFLSALLVAALLVALLLPTGSLALTQYGTVVGGWLRLRSSASFNASTINSYATGTQVKIIGTSGSWYNVEAPDGQRGYMYAEYLNVGGTPSPTPSGNATVVSSNGYGVRLRSGPSTSYRILKKFAVGTRAVILQSGTYWTRIEIGGMTGYMMNQFLSKDGYVPPVSDGDATVWSSNGGGVRLRSGPGTGYSKIGVYSVGTQVKILTKGAVWDYVQIGSRVGYMMNQFLIYNNNYEITGVTINNLYPIVGNTLVVQSVTPATAAVTYQWYVNNVVKGTTASYLVSTDDVGKTIRLVVTGAGSYTGSASSVTTAPVAATGTVTAVTLNIMDPQVGDVMKVGTLTDANASVNYIWKVGGIQKSTNSTYKVEAADIGSKILLIVTGRESFTGSASVETTSAVLPSAAPSITTNPVLPNGELNGKYAQRLQATGGGITWSVKSVAGNLLPSGLTLSSDGLLSGTINAAVGVYKFTITAANSIGSKDMEFTLTVNKSAVTNKVLHGLATPEVGKSPVAAITADNQYTGTITWSPADSTFGAGKVYTASVALTPTANYSLDSITAADFFSVDGAPSGTTVTYVPASKVVTVVYPATPGTQTKVAINERAVSVDTGKTAQFTATVTGSTDKPTWTVSGSTGASMASGIDTNGLLTVAADEKAKELKVTATVGTIADTVTVTITKPVSTIGITVAPTSASVAVGATQQLTATVTGGTTNTATWSLSGQKSANTLISTSGLLTVGSDETAASFIATATSTEDTSKTASATITVTGIVTPEPNLSASNVTFAEATLGYTAPAPMAITVTNSGLAEGTITNVSSSTPSFTVNSTGSTKIASGATDSSWTVQPIGGLTAGTYEADVTFIYDSGKTAISKVTFVVKDASVPAKAANLSVSDVNLGTLPSTYTPSNNQIAITNSGDLEATNVLLQITSDPSSAFTLAVGNSTIASGGTTDTSWSVAPKASLTKGDYSAEITLTYHVDATNTATVVFHVSMKIDAGAAVITINTQPTDSDISEGGTAMLNVAASLSNGATPQYQWYESAQDKSSPVQVGVTTPTFTTLSTLSVGDHYYYCTVSATDAVSVDTTVVRVRVNAAHKIELKITGVPTFSALTLGYADQSPQSITIQNTGNTQANLTSVTVDSAFIVNTTGRSTIDAGQSDTSWTLKPSTGLGEGTHNATVTVTYLDVNGNPTSTSENVSINITSAP
ncbi:MAG: SH3 domain-containing protein [Eubacteriales bacterium]|nr:SH3 domain-containing protein [Eubacteriales bacterium]